MQKLVMLNPFGFPQAKLREAPLTWLVLLAMNEILRRCTPQNDLGEEPVIVSEAKQSPCFLMGDCHVALTGSWQCQGVVTTIFHLAQFFLF
ncbi:MAG: hypothetical protein V3T55_11425 [Anaerolineales bacterium]